LAILLVPLILVLSQWEWAQHLLLAITSDVFSLLTMPLENTPKSLLHVMETLDQVTTLGA
jgi:hypothetical protein